MLKIDIICVSKSKKGALYDLIADYQKRINWKLNIIELESKYKESQKCQADENEKILSYLEPTAVLVILDEKGKSLKSLDFAAKLEHYKDIGQNHIQFVIGGADGLLPQVRKKADILLCFGQQTWPHMLARVMLLEQIYRAQQIMSGHPYHRE